MGVVTTKPLPRHLEPLLAISPATSLYEMAKAHRAYRFTEDGATLNYIEALQELDVIKLEIHEAREEPGSTPVPVEDRLDYFSPRPDADEPPY